VISEQDHCTRSRVNVAGAVGGLTACNVYLISVQLSLLINLSQFFSMFLRLIIARFV